MPENTTPGHDTSHVEMPSESTDGQNRRSFLKAAVVGSATVAAAGAAAAGGLALVNRGNPLKSLGFAFAATQVSPNDPCAVCTTGTDPSNFVDEDTFGHNSLFLWVRFINVPAGSYKINVTPAIAAKGSNCADPSKPLEYQENSTGNNVDFWILTAGGLACHPHALTDWGATTSTSGALPVSCFTTHATQDLAIRVHLKGSCTGAITVTGQLLDCSDNVIMHCSTSVTITA